MVFSSLIFVFLFFVANIITQAVVPDMKKKNMKIKNPALLCRMSGMIILCSSVSNYSSTKPLTDPLIT